MWRKIAYEAGGDTRETLRSVKMYVGGGKTFGELIDAVDNSTSMMEPEKERRKESLYDQLEKEVKAQNIKY